MKKVYNKPFCLKRDKISFMPIALSVAGVAGFVTAIAEDKSPSKLKSLKTIKV